MRKNVTGKEENEEKLTKMKKKRRKIRNVGLRAKWREKPEDFFLFLFVFVFVCLFVCLFLLFTFRKRVKLLRGLQKMEISTEKNPKSRWEKIGKSDFAPPPLKNFPVTPLQDYVFFFKGKVNKKFLKLMIIFFIKQPV